MIEIRKFIESIIKDDMPNERLAYHLMYYAWYRTSNTSINVNINSNLFIFLKLKSDLINPQFKLDIFPFDQDMQLIEFTASQYNKSNAGEPIKLSSDVIISNIHDLSEIYSFLNCMSDHILKAYLHYKNNTLLTIKNYLDIGIYEDVENRFLKAGTYATHTVCTLLDIHSPIGIYGFTKYSNSPLIPLKYYYLDYKKYFDLIDSKFSDDYKKIFENI
jgi:hypothetical protein